MKRNYFNLTYTDELLRLVKIEGKKITSIVSGKLSPGVVSKGKVERPKLFAEKIIELKNSAKPRRIIANEVIAALPEDKVYLKTVEIPKMPLDKINSAISWQIESIIPFKQKDIYFNWDLIGEGDNKLKLLVAVCEKSVVDNIVESLLIAKIKPLIIVFPSIGLANLLTGDVAEPMMIVDLSRESNISLIVAQKKTVYFSTTRNIGTDFANIETIIHDAIDYYQEKYPNKKISKVTVFGLSNLESLEGKLHHSLSQKIDLGQTQNITIIKNIKPEYASYIDNLGLDLSLDKINLLPPEIRTNCSNEIVNFRLLSTFNYFILLLVFILALYGGLWLSLYYSAYNLDKDYSYLIKQQITPKQEELEKEIKDLNNKINLINSITLTPTIGFSTIDKIISTASEGIALHDISISADQAVSIKGIAKTREELVTFKDQLNQLDILSPIILPITALEEKENANFEFITNLK